MRKFWIVSDKGIFRYFINNGNRKQYLEKHPNCRRVTQAEINKINYIGERGQISSLLPKDV